MCKKRKPKKIRRTRRTPPRTFVKPKDYEDGTPERCLCEFFLAWQNEKWLDAFNLCQETWKRNRDENKLILLWGAHVPLRMSILERTKYHPDGAIVELKAKVKFRMAGTKNAFQRTLLINVIKEKDESPVPAEGGDGNWGVNPISMFRGLNSEANSN